LKQKPPRAIFATLFQTTLHLQYISSIILFTILSEVKRMTGMLKM